MVRRTTGSRRQSLLEPLESRQLLAGDFNLFTSENESLDLGLATLLGSSADVYTIVGGADDDQLTIDSNQELQFVSDPNFESPTDSDGDNIYELTVRRTDSMGSEDFTICVRVLNINDNPTAVTNGYLVDRGSGLLLDGSLSSDPESESLVYQWDLNNDGIVDISDVSPFTPVAPSFLDGLVDVGDNTIALTVTDLGGLSDTTTATLTVTDRLSVFLPESFDPSTPTDFTVVREGDEFTVRETETGNLLTSSPVLGLNRIVVNGSAEANTVTLDFSAGLPVAIDYFGNDPTTGAGDALALIGGDADLVRHEFIDPSSGSINVVFGGVSTPIFYTGLEPVFDNLNAVDREFVFLGGSETITLSDDLVAGDNVSQIDSTLGESVTFVNPTSSLLVDSGSGNDIINVAAMDTMYAASMILRGGDGNNLATIDDLVIDGFVRGLVRRGLEIDQIQTATISDTSLLNNQDVRGAGLLINGPSDVLVQRSTITGNGSTGVLDTEGGGGILSIDANLTIADNTLVSGNDAINGTATGGGIHVLGGQLDVLDSTISNNFAAGSGGGITLSNGTSGLLTEASIENNRAGTLSTLTDSGFGGGVYGSINNDLTIVGGSFRGNEASRQGGGIWSRESTVTVDSVLFESNFSAGDGTDDGGGAIYQEAGTLNLASAILRQNEAHGIQGIGGGITSRFANVFVVDSEIDNNHANGDGGGFASIASTLIVTNTNVVSNSANGLGVRATTPNSGDGGGFVLFNDSTLTLNAGIVENNSAAFRGGGIKQFGGRTTVTGTLFNSNQATFSGGGIQAQQNGTIDIRSGATFTNNTNRAIESTDGVLTVTGPDVLFQDNPQGAIRVFGGVADISNSTFLSNESANIGGAIRVEDSTLTVSDSTFTDNTAEQDGGAIAATNESTITISEGTFERNIATQSGGAIANEQSTMTVSNSVLRENQALAAGLAGLFGPTGGGAAYNLGGTLEVRDSIITDNRAITNDGAGGGLLNDSGTIIVQGGTITLNQAATAGGGLANENSGSATLEDVAVTDNISNLGGGVSSVGPTAQLDVIAGSVSDNTASSGGGVFVEGGTALIDGVTIRDNRAFQDGGGVLISSATGTVRDSIVAGNQADSLGGGIGAVNASVDIIGTVIGGPDDIDGNTAGIHGGGIYSFDSTLTLSENAIVEGNQAEVYGGGLYLIGFTSTDISQSTIRNNTALQAGGGIASFDGQTLNIIGSELRGNDAQSSDPADPFQGGGGLLIADAAANITETDLLGNQVIDNAGSGGAILNVNGSLNVNGGRIGSTLAGDANAAAVNGGGIANDNGSVFIQANATIEGNTATLGGGIHSEGGFAAVTVNGSTINANNALFGGGIWSDGLRLDIDGATLSSNVAVTDGGAVLTRQFTNILNSSISTNEATTGSGGGIFTDDGELNVTGGDIVENAAGIDGGGIFNNGASVTSSSVEMMRNSADRNGGGLAAFDATSVVIGGEVDANTAGEEGGGIWISNGSLLVSGSTISNNVAESSVNAGLDQGGGGIFNSGGDVQLTGATLTANLAIANDGSGGSGGGIHSVDGSLLIDGGMINDHRAALDGGAIHAIDTPLDIDGLTIQNNSAGRNGGGIHIVSSTPTAPVPALAALLSNVTVASNTAAEEGGGIWSGATAMSLNDSLIQNNTALSGDNASLDQGGGGIYSTVGTLTVNGSTIEGNDATAGGGSGGGIYHDGISLALNASGTAASIVRGNRAGTHGGGIFATGDLLTMNDSVIGGPDLMDRNDAAVDGGGIYVDVDTDAVILRTDISRNLAMRNGGGIWKSISSALVVSDGSTIDTNAAGGDAANQGGGGIFSAGGLTTVTDSTVLGNVANGISGSGGGIFNNGNLSIVNSEISGSFANLDGGGIFNDGNVSVINSTLAGNTATGIGGGIASEGGSVALASVTIADNAAETGGGIGASGGTVLATNSIITRNTATTDSDVFGALTDDGNNLVSVDAGLAGLAENGGPTRTIALLAGSPALGAGDAGNLTIDQRGTARPQGGATDIGAFESDLMPRTEIQLTMDVAQAEGDSGSTTLAFTVTRSGNTLGSTTVSYSVSGDGTDPAIADDFAGGTFPTGMVTFAADQTTQTISINVAGDTEVEPDESFLVTLSDVSGASEIVTGTATGTILNDDIFQPVPSFSIGTDLVSETEGDTGSKIFAFTVTRSGATTMATSVDFTVRGTGVSPADADDFGGSLPSGKIDFAANETTQTISISVSGDNLIESDESFTITLSSSDVDAVISNAQAQGEIQDDDFLNRQTRIYLPGLVARPHLIPGDSVPTAIIFRAVSDTIVSVTPVATASVRESIYIVDGDTNPISTLEDGATVAGVTAGQLYAILFQPQSTERIYSVRSSEGFRALSNRASTNLFTPTDTNANGLTNALDALLIINHLRRGSNLEGEQSSISSNFLDVNHDGRVSALDAVIVINHLQRRTSLNSPSTPVDAPSTALTSAIETDSSAEETDVAFSALIPELERELLPMGSSVANSFVSIERSDSSMVANHVDDVIASLDDDSIEDELVGLSLLPL
ncbi:putative outer membrane protein PmpB precursor [Rubripirellula obstinata]|uniref:Probable pectate lyase C n=1 Tax=Rubripirellula obstinata TaxID=406547 RepID=A0A5B1CEK0_9BACT|nr:choice-of-anchor Q domain-containing protein [Rubripirellula obstinata]KAA1257883.1 putative outer membrane protein PmpB precursor [Rubripirellula obstinata]